MSAEPHLTRVGPLLSEQNSKQRRLTRPIGPEDRPPFAASDVETQISKEPLLTVGFGHPLDLENHIAGPRDIREVEHGDRVLLPRLGNLGLSGDALPENSRGARDFRGLSSEVISIFASSGLRGDLAGQLHPALRGPIGCGDAPLLGVVAFPRLSIIERTLFAVEPVVALEDGQRAPSQFEDARRCLTQKDPIVRDHQIGGVEGREILRQPFLRSDVEVVGRLVHQQKVGRRQEQFRQLGPRPLPAR